MLEYFYSSNGDNTVAKVIGYLVGFAFFAAAFYLSWKWNSGLGLNVVIKFIFGLFAGLFNLIYIVFFVLLYRGGATTPTQFYGVNGARKVQGQMF